VKLLPKPKPVTSANTNLSQGIELAAGIFVFFLIGLILDAWLNTTPVFMIVLTVFSVVGNFVKMYYAYSHTMAQLEDQRAKNARGVNK
jgi:F0F1-type ATP synthase assembly protein I